MKNATPEPLIRGFTDTHTYPHTTVTPTPAIAVASVITLTTNFVLSAPSADLIYRPRSLTRFSPTLIVQYLTLDLVLCSGT